MNTSDFLAAMVSHTKRLAQIAYIHNVNRPRTSLKDCGVLAETVECDLGDAPDHIKAVLRENGYVVREHPFGKYAEVCTPEGLRVLTFRNYKVHVHMSTEFTYLKARGLAIHICLRRDSKWGI